MAAVMIFVAIGLLLTIFMASFVAILLICKKNKCGKADFNAQRLSDQYLKQGVDLIGARSDSQSEESFELGTCWPDDLPDMFLDPDWDGDAERLVSNCVNLLKNCHQLTESLVIYTAENAALKTSKHNMNEIVAASKQIGPKVDDLVQAMYTPSNSKQIEEKCSALHSSVAHLLQVIKNTLDKPAPLCWADDIMQSITELVNTMKAENNNVHPTPSNSDTSSCQKPAMLIINKAFCA